MKLKIVHNTSLTAYYTTTKGKKIKLINPSKEHVKRLHALGFDILLIVKDETGKVINSELLKY